MATVDVTAVHPEYEAALPQWQRCRDVVEGEDAVKARGDVYLPKLEGQEPKEYAAYKMRALFYGAAARTVEGMAGMLLRKPPVVQPKEAAGVCAACGPEKESLTSLLTQAAQEAFITGRFGLLVDAAEMEGADPCLCLYCAESITNWRREMVNGRQVLTMVVLKEERDVMDGPFAHKPETQYRVLWWRDGAYEVEVYRPKTSKDATTGAETVEWVLANTTRPTMAGGRQFTEIPFVFVNVSGCRAAVGPKPLLALADVCLSHYRNSADLEHGKHFTALPTAWVAGFNTEQVLKIGSSVAWVARSADAKCGFLEFTGAGLNSIAEGMRDKERLMAVLGARLLEEQKKEAETAETTGMRFAGDGSILSRVATGMSQGFSTALQWLLQWKNEGKTVTVEIRRNFGIKRLDPAMLQQLVAAYQAGSISFDTFYYQCEQYELYPDGRSSEEEKAAIAAGGPLPLPGTSVEDTLAGGEGE